MRERHEAARDGAEAPVMKFWQCGRTGGLPASAGQLSSDFML